MLNDDKGEIIIYSTDNGVEKIDVKIINETVWLSLDQMADLFQKNKSTISRHIKNIFDEEELIYASTVAKYATVQNEGQRRVERQIEYYNLDMIISVGYRVKSKVATKFRIWATERLKEYMIKGFVLDDAKLKELGGGNYFKELLERIRDIRSSEKVLYRQVLDLYATSIDYNPNSEESIKFFKIVQNKLHFATHGNTAAEVIFNRANSEKEFMGLTTFKGEIPTLKDIKIAKNYLTENELKILNNLVSGYFDFAEIQAIKNKYMRMNDYVNHLDKILSSTGEKILLNSGSVSNKQAIEKATKEYRKYQEKTLSAVEKEYIKTIKEAYEISKNNK